MMTGVTTLIVVYVLVVTVFSAGQHYDWSPCSRSCGQGTKSRKCQPNDVRRCQYEYADCKVKDCPIAQCTTYKYDSVSDCCSNEDFDKCGVPQIGAGLFRRRIIGGNRSEDGQWPWQVALRKKKTNKFVCGAALLNERWILTAAHCFTDPRGIKHAKDALIVAGISRLKGENPGKQTFDMEKFILHPSNTHYTNDVALAKVAMPVRYSAYVHPICLPDSDEVTQDTICYTAGWGIASVQGPKEASIDLLHVGLRILPLAACEEAYRGDPSSHAITNKVICAGILGGGKDSCIGDSGGPLVCQRRKSCQWFMAGVVSFGSTICGAVGVPGVYVNVQKYQGWIEKTMKINSIPVPGKWQPCSKPCGGGMQFKIKKCSGSRSANCPKKYGGCNTQPCPAIARCPMLHSFAYGESPSSCCIISNKQCGAPKITQTPSLPVKPGHWPWNAIIFETLPGYYATTCSGVLISNNVVLSTATCFFDYSLQFGWRVLLGNTTLEKPVDAHQIYDIESVIKHADYKHDNIANDINDICLLKLSRPANFSSYVMPICLPTIGESLNHLTTCVVVGFPFIPHFQRPVSMGVDVVKVLPMDICKRYRYSPELNQDKTSPDDQHHFCVGDFVEKSSNYKCTSYLAGGGLVCQSRSSCGWYLAGLSSYGSMPCGEAPEVFLNTIIHYEWIQTRILKPPFSD